MDAHTPPPSDPASTRAGLFDVSAFGAVGDGTTDDTDAVLAAVEAAGHHGVVFFGRGRFLITRRISIPTDQTWRGLGISDTGTNQREPQHCILTDVPDGHAIDAGYNTRLERLHLRGRDAGTCLYAHGRVRLDDVNIQHYDTAVRAEELWYGHFSGLRLWANRVGLRLAHSYNLTIVEPRFHCVRPDGGPGLGIDADSDVDLKIFGGSIEGYACGIRSRTRNSIHVYSTYFESSPPRPDYGERPGAVALDLTANRRTSLSLIGCYAYLHHTDAFVDLTGGQALSLVAMGNDFLGGVALGEGPAPTAYRWGADDRPRLSLQGDLWDVDFPENAWYLTPDAPVTGNGIVAPPPDSMQGRLPDNQLITGADVVLSGGQLRLAQVDHLPGVRPSHRERQRGAIVFHTPTARPIVWNGHAWTSFDGVSMHAGAADRLDAVRAAAKDVPLGPIPLVVRRMRRFVGRQVQRWRHHGR